jgi:amino acid transporter
MSLKHDSGDLAEKHANAGLGSDPSLQRDGHYDNGLESQTGTSQNILHQDLKGRHMQMIAMQVQHSIPVICVY